MRLFTKIIVCACLLSASLLMQDALAQCNKTWVKKKCIPKIAPFTHNGQVNSVQLKEGGSTEAVLTFYSGQDYRILVSHEETLEDVSFTILDGTGRTIFESKDHNDTDVWDFKVKTTTQLRIKVNVGKNEYSKGT
ncbi:MAG: hypothetical protein ACRCYO_03435, partial [Bacteroidia bacterium]